MATNTFTNAVIANVVTAGNVVYTAPSGKKSILIELDVGNRGNSGVTCDVTITKSSTSTTAYVIKGAPVPSGGALQVISGQKIVLLANDYITVYSSANNSLDVISSILEDV